MAASGDSYLAAPGLRELVRKVCDETRDVAADNILTKRLTLLAEKAHGEVRVIPIRGAGQFRWWTWRGLSNAPKWCCVPETMFSGGEISSVRVPLGGIFLTGARQRSESLPSQAREANGVVLVPGRGPTADLEFVVTPPRAVRYQTRPQTLVEQMIPSDRIEYAEDATRVTLTPLPGCKGWNSLLISTAGAYDASEIHWYGTRTLSTVLYEHFKRYGGIPRLERGYSYSFFIHDKGLHPFEYDVDGLYFSERVDNATFEIVTDPALAGVPDIPGTEKLNPRTPIGNLPALAQRAVRPAREGEAERPMYGFVVRLEHETLFIEGECYRRLRRILYEADRVDPLVGPERRLAVRALLCKARSSAAWHMFCELFPMQQLALGRQAQAFIDAVTDALVGSAKALESADTVLPKAATFAGALGQDLARRAFAEAAKDDISEFEQFKHPLYAESYVCLSGNEPYLVTAFMAALENAELSLASVENLSINTDDSADDDDNAEDASDADDADDAEDASDSTDDSCADDSDAD
jgi:hypothetical protein